MRIVIVSGMSGAGKSSVMKILEDDGFYCVDNLPAALISNFLQLTNSTAQASKQSLEKNQKVNSEIDNSESETIIPRSPDKIAVGLDIRMLETGGKSSISKTITVIEIFKEEFKENLDIDILFLDASTEILIKRYKETRRIHPIFAMSPAAERAGERVEGAIEEERELLRGMRDRADVILDTSSMLIRDLKQEIDRLYAGEEGGENFYLTFLSFGYKYGIPTDADLVFDVRFLPNPFYVEELRPLTGDDKKVYDYVMQTEEFDIFLNKLTGMIDFLIPNYRIEGKTGLVIAIGCTGGKHRSVTLTNALFEKYRDGIYGCKKYHRDIDKDRKTHPLFADKNQ